MGYLILSVKLPFSTLVTPLLGVFTKAISSLANGKLEPLKLLPTVGGAAAIYCNVPLIDSFNLPSIWEILEW